jgi:protein-S-isoprenylcysteine O-methyltransferase Ste14
MTAKALWSSVSLTLRSLLWTLLLPGAVAGYVPWRFFGLDRAAFRLAGPLDLIALLCILAGGALLVSCIVDFAVAGRGTLSPADPPRCLVVRGLYRYVRNPMYLSVTIIVLGEALLARSQSLTIYWAFWFLYANLFVMGYEEPALRRRFGASYEDYTQRVGRWVPKRRSGIR